MGELGWILNVARPDLDRLEVRAQLPCYRHPHWGPVYEVWLWHRKLGRWFCMANQANAELARQGVVYFWPHDKTLLQSVRALLAKAHN